MQNDCSISYGTMEGKDLETEAENQQSTALGQVLSSEKLELYFLFYVSSF